MFLLVLAACAGVVLVLPLYWYWLSAAARGVASLPGPRPLPFLGNALEFGTGSVQIHANIQRLARTYGNTFRVWMGNKLFVFVAEPRHVEVILSSTVHIRKNVSYEFLQPWLGTGLLTSTGSKWHSRRRMLTPAFHFRTLEAFVDVFVSNGRRLVSKLRAACHGGDVDIYDYVTLCALDVICETAMGVSMKAQTEAGSDYVKAVKKMADIVMLRTFRPWLHPAWLFGLTALGREQTRHLHVLHSTTDSVIRQRREQLLEEKERGASVEDDDVGRRQRRTFLDILLEYALDGEPLSDRDIREEVDTFMFEGHDTTASGISFCLYNLSRHPEVQDAVVQELQAVLQGADRSPSFRELQDMKVLERVLKESLRLHPSVPYFARELDRPLQLDDVTLPPGTTILLMPFVLNRREDLFPSASSFRPDRFAPDAAPERSNFAYVPFSAGPRNCIGQKFALLEMKATLCEVLRHFRLLPGDIPLTLSAELVLRSSSGVHVRLEPRSLQ